MAAKICTAKNCASCGHELDRDELEYPRQDEDGDVICTGCYREKYEGTCDRCLEIVEKTELAMNPGETFALFEPVDDLGRGFYRALRWPIYMNGYVCGYIVERNIQYVGQLDSKAAQAAKEAWTPGGCLCCACRDEVELHVRRYRRQRRRRQRKGSRA